MREPLEEYLDRFEEAEAVTEELLELTTDLAGIDREAENILTNPSLLTVFRYVAAPPISVDDLKTLADATLALSRLRGDEEMRVRLIETVRLGIDRRRFPWVSESREPTEAERQAAIVSTASLLAIQRVATARRMESKSVQEADVKAALAAAGLTEIPARDASRLQDAPGSGEFCGEAMLGTRKADVIVGLYDGRKMPIECKVSNSGLNSIKRLNNDAAVKASSWIAELGHLGVVPAAVLSGVYKLKHLHGAQARGLTIFWAHDLDPLLAFIQATSQP